MTHYIFMEMARSVIGFELIVDDLSRALALFVDVLGLEVYDQGKSEMFEGDMAVVTDGNIAITLMAPATSGDGPVLPDRTPRLSQLIVGGDDASTAGALARAAEAGLAISRTENGSFLSPESIGGALGIETAIVLVSQTADTT